MLAVDKVSGSRRRALLANEAAGAASLADADEPTELTCAARGVVPARGPRRQGNARFATAAALTPWRFETRLA